MIISCPHCSADMDIGDDTLAGDRVYHPRCARWILVGRRQDGSRYGVKVNVSPPVTYPREKRR